MIKYLDDRLIERLLINIMSHPALKFVKKYGLFLEKTQRKILPRELRLICFTLASSYECGGPKRNTVFPTRWKNFIYIFVFYSFHN